MVRMKGHVNNPCHIIFLFFFSPFFFSLDLSNLKNISLQPEKFEAESFFSLSPNLHGCNQQPPSPRHVQSVLIGLAFSSLKASLAFLVLSSLVFAPTPPLLSVLLTGIITTDVHFLCLAELHCLILF